jgi:hypothetical protein
LWPPVAIAIKKNGNNFRALHFLKTTFKMPNVLSPYEKSSRGMIMGVVHTSGELKPTYKHVVEVGTIVKSNKESMHVLEDYPKVCDSLVVMLYER